MKKPLRRLNFRHRHKSGFTIVELLVVVVIIAVLAAISLVMYSGISQKAVASVLQSDLSNASTAIKAFQVEKGNFPTTISTNCTTNPDTSTNKCLSLSGGNTIVGYSANNAATPKTFLLVINNGNSSYKVTDRTAPTQLANTVQPGTTPGAIVELHAAKANGGISQGINSPLTTTWADTSGNNNVGTLTGFTGSPWAGTGTGADPYKIIEPNDIVTIHKVSMPASTSLVSAFNSSEWTVEAWQRLAASSTNNLFNGVYHVPRLNTAPNGYVGINAFVGGNYTNLLGVSTGLTVTDQMHHYVFQQSRAFGQRAYIDGVKVAETAFIEFDKNASEYDWLGNWSAAENTIGESTLLRIYPFGLSATQITANYNAGVDW